MQDIQGLPLDIRAWLNQRDITDEIIARYNIGWTGDMISIPITNKDGKFLFYKYRRNPFLLNKSGPKYIYDKGSTSQLFGLDSCLTHLDIFICEGEFDAMVLIGKGFAAVSSTGGAMTWREEWNEHFKNKTIYVCFDRDDAGVKGAINLHYKFPETKFMELPREVGVGGDITDFFVKLRKTTHDFLGPVMLLTDYWKFIDPSILRKEKGTFNFYRKYADNLLVEQRDLIAKDKKSPLLQGFLDEYVKLIEESKKRPGVVRVYAGKGDRIAQAKTVPISNYLKFNRQGKATCIWHSPDKNPSLHYSEKYNRVYCFACARHGDVIDVIMAQNKIETREALNLLLKQYE